MDKITELENGKKQVKVSAFNTSQTSGEAKELYTIINKPLKVLPVCLHHEILVALMDTGASASLISTKVAEYIVAECPDHMFCIYPINIDISCPTGIVKNAVTGILQITAQFWTAEFQLMDVPMHFLISKTMGSWSIVMGNNLLMSEFLESTISSSHISIWGTSIPIYPSPLGDFDGIILVGERTEEGESQAVILAGCQQETTNTVCSQIFSLPPFLLEQQNMVISPRSKFSGYSRLNLKNGGKTKIVPFSPVGFFLMPKKGRNEKKVKAVSGVKPSLYSSALKMNTNAENAIDHLLTELPEIDILQLKDLTFEDGDFSQCSENEAEIMRAVCKQFPSIFAKNKMDLGKTSYIKHHIQIDPTLDHKSQKQRHLGGVKLEFAKASIKIWEEMGIVSECDNPKFKSNLILVPRSTGEAMDNTKAGRYHSRFAADSSPPNFRLVVDHTSLNAITLNQQSPNSVLSESIIQKLMGKMCTKGDLSLAYYNIELSKPSRPWTCFYLEDKVYQFNRLSMGVNSAPSTFVKFMSLVFAPELFHKFKERLSPDEKMLIMNIEGFKDFIISYFDDFWIFSRKCILTHAVLVKLVFWAIEAAGIKISPKKCTYFATKVTVLGLGVDTMKEEMLMDLKKSVSILSWPRPASLGEVSSRLHSLNYWTKFIPYLRYILAPLYLMVRYNTFFWDEQTELCWAMAKSVLFADIKLSVPKPSDQLIMTSDASKVSCSQLLFKRNGEGPITLVATSSRIFSNADQRREIHYKELISLCLGFKSFYQYFMASDKSILVLVDAVNLISIAREKDRNILASNLLSFVQKMCQAFRFNVFYCPGELNFLANIFSRAFSASRLTNQEYKFSKEFIKEVPKMDHLMVNSEILYTFLSSEMEPHPLDKGSKGKSKPKTLEEVLQFYDNLSSEHCFASAILLLQEVCRNITEDDMQDFPDTAKLYITKAKKNKARRLVSKGLCTETGKDFQKVLIKTIEEIITITFGNSVQKSLKTKIRNALMENARKMLAVPNSNKESLDFEIEKLAKERLKIAAGQGREDLNLLLQVSEMGEVQGQNCDLPKFMCSSGTTDNETCIRFVSDGPYPPRVATVGDCGIDLYIQWDFSLLPGKTVKVNSEVKLLLPEQAMGMIYKRSSAAKLPISVHMGVIDPTYVGYIFLVLTNLGSVPLHIKAGTSIVQVVIHKIHQPALTRVKDFDLVTTRGEKGFGSTGDYLQIPNFQFVAVPLDETIKLISTQCMINGLNIIMAEQHNEMLWCNPTNSSKRISPIQSVGALNFITALTTKISPNPAHFSVVQTRATSDMSNKKDIHLEDLDKEQQVQLEEQALIKLVTTSAQADTSYLIYNQLNKESFLQALESCNRFGPKLNDLRAGQQVKDFVLVQGLLFKMIQGEHKLCIPNSLVQSFLVAMHIKNNHDSKSHLESCFRKDFFHPLAEKLTRTLVQSCITCKYTHWSFSRQNKGAGRDIVPNKPRQFISLDCIPKLVPSSDGFTKYTDILIAMDNYSLFIWAFPMQNRTAASITKALMALFADGQLPRVIMSDGEAGLLAGIHSIQEKYPFILTVTSPPFTPWQNSSEKAVGYVKKALTKLIYNDQDPKERSDWVTLLPLAVATCNLAIIQKLNVSRVELHFNRRNIGIFDRSDFGDLMDNALPDKVNYENKIKQPTPFQHSFKIGDLVVLKQDAPPAVGVNSCFIPKTKLQLYRISKTVPDSGNVHIQCTTTGEEKVAPTTKLIHFSTTDYITAYKKDLLPLTWMDDPTLRKKMEKHQPQKNKKVTFDV